MFSHLLKYLGLSLLIISLVLPAGLHFGAYHWQRKSIRREVKAYFKSGLKAEEIQVFHFSKENFAQLEWEEKEEFIWQDHKYDLISQEETESGFTIRAWLDDKESELRQRFHELLKQHSPPSPEQEVKLIDFFKQYFYEENLVALAVVGFNSKESFWLGPKSESHLALFYPPPL